MIIDDPKRILSIYNSGTMDMYFYRKSMWIGFLESVLPFVGSFLILNPDQVWSIILSFVLMGCTLFIWYQVFFAPTMLSDVILHPNRSLPMVQVILRENKINPEDIHQILVVPKRNFARLISGVYVETNQGVNFYPNNTEKTGEEQFWGRGSGLVFVTVHYAIKDGQIYYNHRNYYEDVHQHKMEKKIREKQKENEKELDKIKKEN